MLNIQLVLYYVAADYKIYIYKLHIWKYLTFTIFTLFTKLYIQNRPKVFQWAPIDVWPLSADVDCPVLWLPLLYLHGLNTRAKLYT